MALPPTRQIVVGRSVSEMTGNFGKKLRQSREEWKYLNNEMDGLARYQAAPFVWRGHGSFKATALLRMSRA